MHGTYTGVLHYRIRAIRIKSAHLHAETSGYAGHVTANLTESMDSEGFAPQLASGSAVIHIAYCHDGHSENQFCYSI